MARISILSTQTGKVLKLCLVSSGIVCQTHRTATLSFETSIQIGQHLIYAAAHRLQICIRNTWKQSPLNFCSRVGNRSVNVGPWFGEFGNIPAPVVRIFGSLKYFLFLKTSKGSANIHLIVASKMRDLCHRDVRMTRDHGEHAPFHDRDFTVGPALRGKGRRHQVHNPNHAKPDWFIDIQAAGGLMHLIGLLYHASTLSSFPLTWNALAQTVDLSRLRSALGAHLGDFSFESKGAFRACS